jgi:HD superfamily phosphohydrolase YqeK
MRTAEDLPSRKDAEAILYWGQEQNPGPWTEHSRVVARVAETIAAHCHLNPDDAYVLGLLHDIGRFEGPGDMHHIVAGYHLLMGKSYPRAARICLTHSFPYQDIGAYSGKTFDCTQEELLLVRETLSHAKYDSYDSLIQLGDALGLPQGVCLLDVRLMDVARRHGFNDFTLKKWDAIFALKKHFDELCECNIYDFFYDEIRDVSFR